MPFIGASSIAFSDDPLRMAVAATDSGYRMTDNGGRSFHVGRVNGYTEANVALKNSCHSVAIHPTNPTLTVISSGFKAAGNETRLFRSAGRFPDSYIGTPGALGTAAGNSPWVRVRNVNKQTFFLEWNRDTPTVVYEDSVRSLDGGQSSWQGYAAGFGGCRAVFPGDHDICYGLTRLTGPERYELRRSNDRGATDPPLDGADQLGRRAVHELLLRDPRHPPDRPGDLLHPGSQTRRPRTLRRQHRHLANRLRHAGAPSGGASGGRPAGVKSIALDAQDANVGYVVIESPGNHSIWRSQSIQAASPEWEDITFGFHRSTVFPKVWVHPLTGDVLAGSDGVGGIPDAAAARPPLAPVARRQLAGALRDLWNSFDP